MKTNSLIFLLLAFAICIFGQQMNKGSEKYLNFEVGKLVTVYTTTADSSNLKLTITDTLVFNAAKEPREMDLCVLVTPAKTYQTILGIGGAITDASAEVFAKLPKDKQQELLTAYYDKTKGIGYTLGRTNINSCDFSSDSYSYVTDVDKELKTFNINHDKQYRIPLIQQAIKAADGKLTLFASPWSPPPFMKDNNSWLRGGTLLPEYYQSWATYFAKFIKAYAKESIPIWGITVQNEPFAKAKWESCTYTAEQERDFVKNFLGPTMKKEGLSDKKIIVYDHNRGMMNFYADIILRDPEAAKYVWGVGYHWYESLMGGHVFNNVANVYEMYPDKNVLLTEACVEEFDAKKYYYKASAERYGKSMINDFRSGAVGWTDWNILLDEHGGPNHLQNYCFAPVHAETQTGKLIYTPSFYYIGHFSKFVRPNAKRISTIVTQNSLIATSFLNPDSSIVTVVMNETDNQLRYSLFVGLEKVKILIPPHAIQSLNY